MKWYDKYFLAFMVLGILSMVLVPAFVYQYSPPAAVVGFMFSVALTIGVRLDWKDFKKRHNLM